MSSFEYLETPFKQVQEELTTLQNQLEHFTWGISMALNNRGSKHILRELAMKTNQSKVHASETKKAQLAA